MIRLTIDDQYTSMPWDAIDAVVFDVGNVLLRFDPTVLVRELLPGQEAIHQRVLNKTVRTPYWIMLDHGTMTKEEAIAAMIGRDTELAQPIRQVMEGWQDLKEPIAEGVEAVRCCKTHGKKVYVLSNYHDGAFAHAMKKHSFFDLFDGMVVSARVELVKPDPAIYRYLTDKFCLEPGRTLFIDDTPANIEGAIHAGWQGLCYNEPGKIARFLAAGRNA